MAAPANNSASVKQRVVTGISLGAVFLAALLGLPTPAWVALMFAVVGLGAWEWAALVKFGHAHRLFYTGLTPLLGLVALYAVPTAAIATAALLFWLFAVPLWLARGWRMPLGPGGALLGWLLLVPTFYAAVSLHAASPLLVLGGILLAVIADSAAYFSGRKWGRRKLAPQISPGKSWEGAIGAAIAVAVYALAVGLFFLHATPGRMLLLLALALVLFAASIMGDLFESLGKRQAGIKDSGHWLPGHGGVLDRIDSLTAVLPLALCFLLLWQSI